MRRSHVSGRIFVAVLLIALGVLFLLDRHGYLDAAYVISRWWPSALILLGLEKLLLDRARSSGFILVAIGVCLQLTRLEYLDRHFIRDWWPLALIAVGVAWLFQARTPIERGSGEWSGDTLHSVAILGSHTPIVRSQAFRGGDVSAVLGNVSVDLREARLDKAGAHLDATAVLGGVEVRVPADWEVVITGTPILGGAQDSRLGRRVPPGPAAEAFPSAAPPGGAPRLAIRATALFGQVEVKD